MMSLAPGDTPATLDGRGLIASANSTATSAAGGDGSGEGVRSSSGGSTLDVARETDGEAGITEAIAVGARVGGDRLMRARV